MPAPPAYLDECVDRYLVEALRRRGFDVTAATNEGMAGAADEQQLVYATAHQWILVSHNEIDFRRLHRLFLARAQAHAGIMLVTHRPPIGLLEVRSAMMLDWIATLPERQSHIFRWGQLQQLLQRGYRLPGYSEADVEYALGR